jgi:hypothetical protein
VAGDTAILNAASGASVVTLGANVTLNILTMTGFTGTLAFSTFGINLISTAATQVVYTGAATYSVTGTDPTITVTVTGTHNDITFAAGAVTEANAINVIGYGSTFSAAWTVSGNVKDMLSYGLIIYNVNRTVYRNYGQFPNAGIAARSGSGNSSQTTFAGSGTQTITCNGNEIGHWFAFAGTGTIVFADAFILNSNRTLAHTSGTINANNMNVTLGSFTSTGATARTVNMGSGTWTILNFTWTISGSNYTINCGTSTVFVAVATTSTNFTTGDVTYHNIVIQGGTGALLNFASTVSCTINDISNNVAPARISLSNATTLYVTGNFNLNGTAVDDVLIAGSSDVSPTIISKSSGTVNCSYLGLANMTATGGATWNANHSWANLTTGWNVTNTDTRYWVGGSGTWDTSNTANWSLTSNGSGGASVPTSATRVVFSSESGGGTVTIGATVSCRILLFQNAYFNSAGQHSGTMAFGTNFVDVYGENRTVVKGGTTTAFTGTGGIRLVANATSGTRACQSQNATEANAPKMLVTAGSDTVSVFEFTKGLVFTGFSGTLFNASRTVYGDFVGSPTMTHSGSAGVMSFRSSTPAVIDCAGCTLGQPVTINSTSTYTLTSDLKMTTTRPLLFTAGTFDANDFDVTAGPTTLNGGTVVIYMGAGTWNIWSNWNPGSFSAIYSETSTICMKSTTAKTFIGNNQTYYILDQGGAGALTITGNNTFNDWTASYLPSTITVTAGSTQTFTNFTTSGILNDTLTINSTGSTYTFSKASGTVAVAYIAITNCIGSGGATWTATYSTQTTCTNWTTTNLATTYYWVGGTGTWDNATTTNWSLSSGGAGGAGYPLPADTVIFNASSGAGTCTIGTTVNCKTLTMTGYTGTLAFGSNKIQIAGANGTVYTGGTSFTTSGTTRLDFVYPGRNGTRTITPDAPSETYAMNIYITAGLDGITLTSGSAVKDLIFTDGYSAVGLTNLTRTIYGSLYLSPNMTVGGGTAATSFAGTGSHTIQTNGVVYGQSVNFTGVGGTYTLLDNFSISTRNMTFVAGTFDAAGHNVSCSSISSSGAGIKIVHMGSGTWTLSLANGNTIAFGGTNLTVNKDTASIVLNGTTGTNTIYTDGKTLYRLVISKPGTVAFATSNSIFDYIENTTFPIAVTISITTPLTCNLGFDITGNSTNQSTLSSATPGSIAYISAPTGVVVNPEYLTITDVGAMGGAKWDTYGNIGNINGGNSPGWLWYQSNVDNAAFMGFF